MSNHLLPVLCVLLSGGTGIAQTNYMPLRTGLSWDYRVTFTETVQLPYRPTIEAPQGLLCASTFCGLKQHTAGQIDFKITVNESLGTINGGESFRVAITNPGGDFYFARTDPMEMRARPVGTDLQLELIDTPSGFRLARPLARPTAAELAQKQSIAVPAGSFPDVVKTTLTLNGDGIYVSGTYTSDVYLAPGVGLIKAVMRDPSGKTLFTQELTASSGAAASTTPSISGVSNGASGQPGVTPNSWVTIYGANFAPANFTDDWSKSISGGKLPTSLDGVSVSIGGQPAYVYFLSPGQINVLAPNVSPGPVAVTVTTSAGTSAPFPSNAQAVGPAFFQWPGNYAVATRQDFTYAVKDGVFAGVPTVAAQPGEVIILWGTGFGATNPAAPIGAPTPASAFPTASPVTVQVGGTPATVFGAALAPGFAGLYQVAIQIPASLASGDYPVVATVAGSSSPAATLLTVSAPPCQSNCTISTSVGTFGVASAQLGDRFPIGCSPGPACSMAQPGFQVLAVFLELQGSLKGSVLDLANPSAYVMAEDGSKTAVFTGGLLSGKYFIAFTPSNKVKKFVLYWPGNAPVDLSRLLP
jgi:uncharacterized protein (TIGR03437 family)